MLLWTASWSEPRRYEKAKDLRIAYQNEELSVTISAGVAMLPNHGPSIEDALKAADEALYQAKAEGRDRVVAASS
jgi:diguanylate cyclase (GGDEF)-like protein